MPQMGPFPYLLLVIILPLWTCFMAVPKSGPIFKPVNFTPSVISPIKLPW